MSKARCGFDWGMLRDVLVHILGMFSGGWRRVQRMSDACLNILADWSRHVGAMFGACVGHV